MPEDDSPEAKKQAEQVKKMLQKSDMRNDDGLTEAMKHLSLAAFRGRSAIKPFFDKEGNIFFKKLENWNVLQYQGNFYWNPSSEQVGWFDTGTPVNVVPLPKEEICYVSNSMPIDVPGLMVYLRQLVGEEQWARFVEKQGIPQVIIEAPEGTPEQNLPQWNYRAMQIFEGGSGTLPYGAKVNMLDSARGQDPFSEYVKHQMEMVCIMSLGGILLAMPGPTGLGSDLARVQQEAFDQLVTQDCKKVANAMSDSVVPKCAKVLGWDKARCRFTFIEDEPFSPLEYLEMAEKAHALGMKIDTSKFKSLTKLQFIAEDEVWTPPRETSPEWTPEEKQQLKPNVGEDE